MNLLDHFRPPVNIPQDWAAFHSAWMHAASDLLGELLVPPWYSQPRLHFGREVDVAGVWVPASDPQIPGLYPTQYDPADADGEVPLNPLEDDLEIEVIRDRGGRELVGAVEFASPANLDRPESRAGFAAKCEALLAKGIGVAMVDVVTEKNFSLYASLMHRLGEPGPPADCLYAASFHPVTDRPGGEWKAEYWYRPLSVGGPLPTLPLFLRDGPTIELNFQASYDLACERSRLARDLARLAAAEPNAHHAADRTDPLPA